MLRAMALGFAEAGADLVLADFNTEGMEDTASLVEKMGRRVLPITCDVSQPDLIREMFGQLDQEYGRIDILGNVAGDGVLARAEEITIEQVQKILQSLIIGRFCCCQEAGKRMLAIGKGSIINIGSLASTTALGRGHLSLIHI